MIGYALLFLLVVVLAGSGVLWLFGDPDLGGIILGVFILVAAI